MARLLDLAPADVAALVRAAPELLEHLRRLVDEERDVLLHVHQRPGGAHDIEVTALAGDAVVDERVFRISRSDQQSRLVLAGLHVEQILKRVERWKRATNPRLSAAGAKPFG